MLSKLMLVLRDVDGCDYYPEGVERVIVAGTLRALDSELSSILLPEYHGLRMVKAESLSVPGAA